MGNNNGADEMHQLLQLTEKAVRKNKTITTPSKLSPHNNSEQLDVISHSFPRVNTMQPLEDTTRRMTRSMTKDTPLVSRVSLTSVPRVEKTPKVVQGNLPLNHKITKETKLRRRRQGQSRPNVSDSAPAHYTRSKTIPSAPAAIRTRTSTRASM